MSDVKTGDWDHINWVKYDTCTPVVSPDGNFAIVGWDQGRRISVFSRNSWLSTLFLIFFSHSILSLGTWVR